jgi:hypothetical protein
MRLEVPPDYMAVGRVAVAGAKLDVILGQVAVAAGLPVQRPGDG